MENISERVKKEREARGITLEELAKGTFISVAVLKDIESGNFDTFKGDELYLKMYLRKIAKYLGLDEKENSIAHFFKCKISKDIPMLGGEELERCSRENYYEVRKVNIHNLDNIDMLAKDMIIKAYNNGFMN